MKSAVASAALGAALFSQASLAATIGHKHAHLHHREAAPEKRTVQFMSLADVDVLQSQSIKIGLNVPCADEASHPITIGQSGPFVVEYNNKGTEDIVLIVWSANAANPYLASMVTAQQPDVTHTIQANTTAILSFDPSKNGGSISGAWAAMYPGDKLNWIGQVDNTWGEYTFTTESQFSTTDVSRLINMNGKDMEIHNYATKQDAYDDAVKPACSATMNECAFVCSGGALTCIAGAITGCAAGTANTDSNASGMDGGCTGLTPKGGHVMVTL